MGQSTYLMHSAEIIYNTLHQRQLLNLSRIKTKYGDPVAIHFYTDGHTIQDFSVIGLEELHGDETVPEDYKKLVEGAIIYISTTGYKYQSVTHENAPL